MVDDARGQRVRPLGARRWPEDPAAARLSVEFVYSLLGQADIVQTVIA